MLIKTVRSHRGIWVRPATVTLCGALDFMHASGGFMSYLNDAAEATSHTYGGRLSVQMFHNYIVHVLLFLLEKCGKP